MKTSGGASVRRVILKSVLLALIIGLVIPRPAQAYIDPSTGGMLFQVLATGLALFSGVALIFSRQIRMAFARARRALRGLLDRGDLKAQDEPVEPQAADIQIEAD
jgi:hypothetical protein